MRIISIKTVSHRHRQSKYNTCGRYHHTRGQYSTSVQRRQWQLCSHSIKLERDYTDLLLAGKWLSSAGRDQLHFIYLQLSCQWSSGKL